MCILFAVIPVPLSHCHERILGSSFGCNHRDWQKKRGVCEEGGGDHLSWATDIKWPQASAVLSQRISANQSHSRGGNFPDFNSQEKSCPLTPIIWLHFTEAVTKMWLGALCFSWEQCLKYWLVFLSFFQFYEVIPTDKLSSFKNKLVLKAPGTDGRENCLLTFELRHILLAFLHSKLCIPWPLACAHLIFLVQSFLPKIQAEVVFQIQTGWL